MSPSFTAIVPAAGLGTRLGDARPKQYLDLNGRPMIHHALAALARVRRISRIFAVLSPGDQHWDQFDWRELAGRVEVLRCGGAQRGETVLNALDHLAATLAQRLVPLMERSHHGGSLVTMTYVGGERVVPGYNVMGVAKAALEASVRYLAADLGARLKAVGTCAAARTAYSPFRDQLRCYSSAGKLDRHVTLRHGLGVASRNVERRALSSA